MKEKTCCFTGHRNIPAEAGEEVRAGIREEALRLMESGYTTFLAGGARGFDMLAAEAVLDLRDREGKAVRLISVLPFKEWRDGWPADEYEREERILRESDGVLCPEGEGSRASYLDRDRRMVDASSVCVAWCTRRSGGTAYTVRYAMKQGVRVVNMAGPDPGELLKKTGRPG